MVTAQLFGQFGIEPGLDEGLPSQLTRLHVDHATPAGSSRRSLFQILWLKDEVLVRAHLDDFSTHQTKLKGEETQSNRKNQVGEKLFHE